MLALGIRYLNGFVVAADPDSYVRPEWPPHPGRVFMALAAAHFETGGDPSERAALEWLEALGEAPAIRAGEHFERTPVTQYVPVNDKAGPAKAQLQSAPLTRDRQGRSFAQATLESDTVYLVWRKAVPDQAIRLALEALCGKVPRMGHSSSLVQMWIASADESGSPNWVPADDRPAVQLRMAGPGTLADLERRYNGAVISRFAELQVFAADDSDRRRQLDARQQLREQFPGGEPTRLRPALSLYRGYARVGDVPPQEDVPGSVFESRPMTLMLELDEGSLRYLDLTTVLVVTQRWRDAILSHSNGLPSEVRSLLSGHDAGGKPLDEPHLTFLPLAFVGHPEADGRLLGMGVALPDGVLSEHRRLALSAVAKVQRLLMGPLGAWRVLRDKALWGGVTLRAETWTGYPNGATQWATVTPVVFDRHPKTKDRGEYLVEAAGMIAAACERIGLPRPQEVVVTPVSAHLGVPPAHAFPRLARKDGSERRHAHAILVFERPVRGPIVLGAGRYRGYGLARPVV